GAVTVTGESPEEWSNKKTAGEHGGRGPLVVRPYLEAVVDVVTESGAAGAGQDRRREGSRPEETHGGAALNRRPRPSVPPRHAGASLPQRRKMILHHRVLRSAPRLNDQKPYPRLNRLTCSGAGWISQIC